MKRDSLVVGIVGLFVFTMAFATTWYVHPDSMLNSIKTALYCCAANDTVLVGPGIYNENIVWPITQGIDLVSELGRDTTIIDGDSAGSVIVFETATDSTTVIKGFTIQHGYSSEDGGGIYVNYYLASPMIIDNSIVGNHAYQDGGGIGCVYGRPLIIGNTISNNTAGHDGGGISCWKSEPTIVENVVSGNTAAHYGGGMNLFISLPVVTSNTISDNHALCGGGIFHSSGGGISVFTGNTITGNTATAYGGGIYCYEFSQAYITLNTITGNSAQKGGGIGCFWSYPIITSNTIIANNAVEGGGIDCDNSDPLITGNTIAANCSTGICFKNGSVPLINYNNIIDNAGYGLCNIDTSIMVSAEYNWWGHATGPYHANFNPGGLGDSVSDHVDFDPWLTAPVGIGEEPITKPVTEYENLSATIVSGPLRLPEGKKYRVYDIMGRVVEPSMITRGIYFIEIDEKIVQKVVKIR
ncbi:MAG: right-handed parallel beta-helix repeat-containing protein [candidate division WOR-3 bacterium]|nr:right-handed parallel beta-helix repeat-containing protein [candidate division WOR-3 bacterium]